MYTGSEPFFYHIEGTPEIKPAIAIPSGFRSILGTSFVSPRLTEVLIAANCDTQVKAFSGYEGTTAAELAFADKQCYLIQQHMDQRSSQSATSSLATDAPKFEQCVCLGIWAYRIRMIRSVPPDFYTCSYVGYRLKAALMISKGLDGWQNHMALLLWLAFVGAHSTLEEPLRQWYVLLLKTVSVVLSVSSWEDAKTCAQRLSLDRSL
jgi:hypothetical protein